MLFPCCVQSFFFLLGVFIIFVFLFPFKLLILFRLFLFIFSSMALFLLLHTTSSTEYLEATVCTDWCSEFLW